VISGYLAATPREPSIFQEDEEADALRHAEALAHIAAGRLIPNDDAR
jgi:hypothetical protein